MTYIDDKPCEPFVVFCVDSSTPGRPSEVIRDITPVSVVETNCSNSINGTLRNYTQFLRISTKRVLFSLVRRCADEGRKAPRRPIAPNCAKHSSLRATNEKREG
ncbi:hypothetical protein WN51_02660 [Melipona quadrifasciata]|uniref:Uncharacterized protein n=1 Tax=Melipona quadrifasciata TaxID=166423 RepID=A0A0M9A8H2_9HYME|nr:hypothetical protein WN51_02660 [Melipona quadrifasciata]